MAPPAPPEPAISIALPAAAAAAANSASNGSAAPAGALSPLVTGGPAWGWKWALRNPRNSSCQCDAY